MNKIIDEEVLSNYKKSLKQKYNAVCLDIDGTITKENSKNIDEEAIRAISQILMKNIPLVFITGRGETGIKDLLDDIVLTLKEKYNISRKELRKIYVLSNDGARLFYTEETSKKLLNCDKYLVSQKTIESLKKVDKNIKQMIEKTPLKDYCKITYSEDSKNKTIINIRLNCGSIDEDTKNEIYSIISNYVESFDKNLTTTQGIYKGDSIIQIGLAKKEIAVEKAEEIIGVPKNSMIRIGDCGDEKGNDYTMLNCPQGFSVKNTSQSKDSCFPIINEDKEVLTGVAATLYILKKAKILPTICLESINKDRYKSGYASIEKQINIGRNKQINRYDDLFNAVFNVNNGIKDVFDENTGSVIIPMYEWELLPEENLLKKFYEEKNNKGNCINMLRDNTHILLRGSSSYYYFLANRKSTEDGDDYTSLDNIYEWYDNYIEYFKKASEAVDNTHGLSNYVNKRLVLGLLDNIRNAMLVTINSELIENYPSEKSVILNLNGIDNKESIKKFYNLLIKTHRFMIDICTDKYYIIKNDEIKDVLLETSNLLEIHKNLKLEAKEKDYSKTYRAYREIDNFAENFLTVSLVYNKNPDDKTGMCGLSYGGLELPIIYKSINDNAEDIVVFKFSKQLSNYKNSHSIEIRNYGIEKCDIINNKEFNTDSNYILADDNLLTAKTMQLAINSFYDLKANVQRVLIVRYPSINRFSQMLMENHGAVDYKQFFGYIQGLLFPSPYTYRDEHNGNKYLDSLGVFDINRQKILECIYKNHDFKEDTEVSLIKKRR